MEDAPQNAEESAQKVLDRIRAKQVELPKHLLQCLTDLPKKLAAAAAVAAVTRAS